VGRPCPYCRFVVKPGTPTTACDTCAAVHHADCWTANDGCAILGCRGAATAVAPPPTHPPAAAPAAAPASAPRRFAVLALGIVSAVAVVAIVVAAYLAGSSGGDAPAEQVARPPATTVVESRTVTVREQAPVADAPDTAPAANPGTAPPAETPVSSASWPGYTVVLASKGSVAEAEGIADRARAAGLPDVGTLHSSDHSSLRPGFWVVYSATFGSRDASAAAAADARAAGFQDAYPRYVSAD
jgi:hypothetical protein